MNLHRTIVAILLLSLSTFVSANDEETLREFKTVLWPKAYRTQDVELLDRLLHDSFVVINDAGEASTKKGELEYIANNQWDKGEFEYRIERLDIYDSKVAIISGKGIASNYSYTSSNVLIKEDGRWQAISSHVSGIKEKPDAPMD